MDRQQDLSGGPGPETLDCDVLIIGGGLAGLALARQLLLVSDKRVALVDRRELPPRKQKVGEATVQMSGYYYARVLEMEEHLLCEHYLKYNLRFYWPTGGRADRYEELSQSYLRELSNICTYQLDRNAFEAELLRVNRDSARFVFHAPVSDLAVELGEPGAEPEDGEAARRHHFSFSSGGIAVAGRASWVVDASGRGKFLTRRLGLAAASPIRHGTTFCWVEGLVDAEKCTDLSPSQIRTHRGRQALGHTPAFLATNHFCGEGYWFWTIPLHGKTSLGLVYDRSRVPREQVSTPQKMIDWVCRQYPMFARDLPGRKVVDFAGFTDYAYDCTRTLDASGWALCGEACRFTDPLYSPGGDLISVYNTLITDAILTVDRAELEAKVPLYEAMARAVYDAYVPSFAVSYDTLGDQESFTLRYTWELSVYFAFFVFPFINDLFTEVPFLRFYLRRFTRLGPTNRNLHEYLAAYYHWKKARGLTSALSQPAARDQPATAPDAAPPPAAVPPAHAGDSGEPFYFEFSDVVQLREARACFYRVGLSVEEAKPVIDEQLASLEELARAIVAQIAVAVTGDRRALAPELVAGIDLRHLRFDPEAMAARLAACPAEPGEPSPRIAQPALERLRLACAPRQISSGGAGAEETRRMAAQPPAGAARDEPDGVPDEGLARPAEPAAGRLALLAGAEGER
jgi:flavin-dependent dehydrogenase